VKSRGIDDRHLGRALGLAERGRYGAPPNPMVGAVVVKNGRVVAEGHHRRAGGAHAEIEALEAAGKRARGADLYLTLEPCAHHGRTPPCAPAVAAAGVRRVIVAAKDPNPRVSGRGLRMLRRAGVEVVLAPAAWRRRAAEQNAKFFGLMERRRPFVLAKWASTLDGRLASARGESRWITGEAARRRGLLLREEYDAVLVGAGTVRADDPRLTRRLDRAGNRPHWRLVLDGLLRVPESARVLRGPGERVVVTAARATHPKARRLAARGVRVWSLPARKGAKGARGAVDLERLLAELARHGVTSLMVEGGARTLGAFFRARLVDRVAVFLAPRILGGERALGAVGGAGFTLGETPRLSGMRVEAVGEDLLVTGRVRVAASPRK
jgi:diaminohydroxyphosphoribosylaminopyrimidine deaminase/5-amino-6-(5-phosphoribosylamino)uracil reductase